MAREASAGCSLGGSHLLPLLLLLLLLVSGLGRCQREPGPGGPGDLSLHPPYFNLAEGTRISASATCGEEPPPRSPVRPTEDLYCKLVGGPVAGGDPNQTIQGQYCDICTAANSNKAHPVTNAIDGTERWWQSPPLSRGLEYNEINVTLDLGQLFHVAYVLIKFANSPRPDLWVLEHSTDFGLTYQPWQYFASSKTDCIEKFGLHSLERITKDDDAICTTEYSRIVPLENGEIVVSLVNGRPGAMNFSYSPLLRDFTKATNIRLRFLRTNTLLGHLMGKALRDPTVTRRYYYSIKDISIGGRCVCHGHADACDAKDPNNPFRLQCACQHNTCGTSCDRCCPGFNQVQWKPATTNSANECESCNCNGHAYDCYYDPEVERIKASQNRDSQYRGGGVCIDCQHHTTGINCEHCIPGYYRSPNHPVDSPSACYRCSCDSEFQDGTCEDLTGRCYCKPNYTGERCAACAEGYTDFPHCYPVPSFSHNDTGEQVLPAGQIINCDCSAAGTKGNACRKDAQLGVCVCKPSFQGDHCEQCVPGHYGPGCQACQCSGPGQYDGSCDSETGQCVCRAGFEGPACDQCAPGYFNYPLCRLCGCSVVGTEPEVCDAAGTCLCQPEFAGPHCDHCSPGHHSYPHCQACACDPRGSLEEPCSPAGTCRCLPNFSGPSCHECAPGFYGFPSCNPCHCSREGSFQDTCDQETGQCACRSLVTGLRCDTCVPGAYGFPRCEVGSCDPAGQDPTEPTSSEGSCECRAFVEGPSCERCKPLYWNLMPDNPYGCTTCLCNTQGTLGGVAECQQASGQCFCKPSVCGRTCSICKDGYYRLDQGNYFGCQSCHCDIGGALAQACEARTGACHCRQNTQGPTCNEPAREHYFPDLHHLQFEVEEGRTPDGRTVRFGYNPLEFENFSWRGYAQMSPVQPKVVVMLNVTSPDLFRLVFRYVNRGLTSVEGTVSVLEEGKLNICGNCTEQTKQIVFPPSTEPAYVTVPQSGYGEPFVLNPSLWTLVVEAEGVLLDHVVLLPSAYYEAPVLQLKVSEPCTYSPAPELVGHNCILYHYLPLDGFSSGAGKEATCRLDNSLPRPCQTEQLSPSHPPMAICQGQEVDVQLWLAVSEPGRYALLVEYANEDALQGVGVTVSAPQLAPQQGTLTLYPCKYSFLCRGVVLDAQNRLAAFELTTEATIRITAERARFFLHRVYLVPFGEFTTEFIEPKVHCLSTHGAFLPSSGSCVPSRFQKLSQPIVLQEFKVLPIPADFPLFHAHTVVPVDPPSEPAPRPPTANDPTVRSILLQPPQQGTVVLSTHVQTLGRYAFLLHGYQPLHPTFPVEVLIGGGRVWHGQANATFCPHAYGCRSLVVSENQVVLDVTDNELTVTLRVPEGRQLWLDYVLVVPEDGYNPGYLVEEPLDKSYDFISHCGANGFHISPASPRFCQDAAISLSLFYNNGAQPCGCHEVGAMGRQCQPFGGQCPCRAHVIGRDCSRCATGYWGFPNCRPCECGPRLCEEESGQCICPPRTVEPDCVVCQAQTFGCHPLVGCEDCNCSRPGVQDLSSPDCHLDSGQCRCKPNIVGRRCDLCVPGFFGYPNCQRCDCHEAGTVPSVCDPSTGQCHCKENVEGARCDQCRLGTFSLDPANPKGCTRCFCFGATDRCRSTERSRSQFIDMQGWTLLTGDRQEVPTSLHLDAGLVHADLRNVPEAYQELYWQAPPSYLGDRVSSYGGFLKYELHSETQRGDVYIPVEARPDVILKGNQMSLSFLEGAYPAPGDVHRGQVQLVEGNFRHTETRNPASREELMMVLAGLEQLQLRALFSQISSAVSLRQVVLELVPGPAREPAGAGPQASNVELCMCPANYRGDSCQECAPGYYRDTKGLFLGKCVPCHCNGHSDRCLAGSGICVNCQHHTEGDHCERCQDGFLGNGTQDQPSHCVGCPCPLSVPSNSFAIGCVHKGSATQCLCRPGYAGASCERCAPGYYGNPMVIGSSCQPCECSGNGDTNTLFQECDPLTGACTGCMYHTAGPRCESCAPGYYGDALVAKNCTRCDCSTCGTESCDPRSGQCLCKAGVTGLRCDHCQEGHFGFDSCSGCQRCDCGVAALGPACHPQSGQCQCRPGVTGARCQQCAPGYWGLGGHGCAKCHCRGGPCDPRTGECTCPHGLSGKQCDTCSHQHHVPVAHGPDSIMCEVCDSCVVLLLDDLQRIDALLPAIRLQLSSLNASSVAWARLHTLNVSIVSLATQLRDPSGPRQESRMKLEHLEQQSVVLDEDGRLLHSKAGEARTQADSLRQSIEDTRRRAETLLNSVWAMERGLADLVRQMDRLSPSNTSVASGEELRQKMAAAERALREMRERDLRGQRRVADGELGEAQILLDRVRSQMGSQLEANKELVDGVRARLELSSSQIMDLRDALNEAVNKTRRTEELNSLNQNALEEWLQKKQELQRENETLRNTLKMAEAALARGSDFLQTVDKAKEELERLAANLDGARGPLTDKMQVFSPASSKIPIVERAEAHALQLDQLAQNLSSIIRDTNQDRFIQRAIEASNAYASIIQAVKEAESAARQALLNATDVWAVVVRDQLGSRARELRENSSVLEEAVQREQKKLSWVVRNTLQSAQVKLENLRVKKEELSTRLGALKDMLAMDGDGTSGRIAQAKAQAAEANATAARTMSALRDMQEQLELWQRQYGGLRGPDLDRAVEEAGRSVSSLEKTLPQLLAQLSRVENRRSRNASLSESILRVRQLITQARNTANKVKVPMKFNGQSGVQLRPPLDLQDLAAYTALKFYIQNPQAPRKPPQRPPQQPPQPDQPPEAQFVLYLGSREATGDYMGVLLRDHRVQWVYRLGEQPPTVVTVDEDIGEQFAMVNIDRTLQFGHMSVTLEKQTVHETKADGVSPGDQGLLNFQPHNFVFYVGGYPSGFTPPEPLRFPGYQGCIEVDTLNQEVISLYNFLNTFQLDTATDKPCARSKSTGDPWLTDGSYLDGTGYARIGIESQLSPTKRFEQELRLVSSDGIIFFLKHQDQFLCLAVRQGVLVLYYDFNTGLQQARPSHEPPLLSTTNKAIQIFLLGMTGKKRILVRLERATVFTVEQENSLEQATAYYLGGVPPAQLPTSLQALFPTGGSIRGCVKGLKALGKYVDLKRLNTTGISSGCTSDLLITRSMAFHGHGYLTLGLRDIPSLIGNFYTGFGFRSSQEDGLLYYHAAPEGTCQVVLQRGRVALQCLKKTLTTKAVFADGAGHYVAFYSDPTGIRLYVDDQLQATGEPGSRERGGPAQPPQPDSLLRRFHLGGLPESGALPRHLRGCIGNVFVKRESAPQWVVDLQQSIESVNVTTGCLAPDQPHQVRAAPRKAQRRPKDPSRAALHTRRSPQESACHLPKTVRGAFQFWGSPASYLEFGPIPDTARQRTRFSMDVRLSAPDGLLVYVPPTPGGGASLLLGVSRGHFLLLAGYPGRRRQQLRVRSRKRYKTGRWHTVFFSRERNRVQLVLDGLRAQSSTGESGGPLGPGPFYIGGIPRGQGPSLLPEGFGPTFSGCLKNLRVNGRPLGAPKHVAGVTPCYTRALERGLFFASDGGVVTVELPQAQEPPDLELELELRPQAMTGLVFYLGSPAQSFLSLSVDRNLVTVKADDGAGEFSTSVSGPPLCDGQWHRIAVIKERTAIRLRVDTQGNWTVGPSLGPSPAGPQGPLHLGGLPEAAETSRPPAAAPSPRPYRGCMRNLLLNRRPVDLSRSGPIRGSVGVNGCPAV
ncbi:laminin subunit alpha-5 [Tachyglossus aculeatus]|uniref:laminin subunit alpha-5 n=1 Tax=Tachyglossus aculeatus TaxID=9261 RepID=UPI0018F3E049|nr:laminin subunit alpha-5 [Tachyglossus aculeatus]